MHENVISGQCARLYFHAPQHFAATSCLCFYRDIGALALSTEKAINENCQKLSNGSSLLFKRGQTTHKAFMKLFLIWVFRYAEYEHLFCADVDTIASWHFLP